MPIPPNPVDELLVREDIGESIVGEKYESSPPGGILPGALSIPPGDMISRVRSCSGC